MAELHTIYGGEWNAKRLKCALTGDATFPAELQQSFDKYGKENSIKFNPEDYVPKKIGIQNYQIAGKQLRLTLKRVPWVAHQAVQDSMDKPVINGKTIRELYFIPDRLDKLPNLVGTNWAPINVDRKEILLQVRSKTGVGIHGGTLSVPGGYMDVGDTTPLDTCIRELGEEIGLRSAKNVTVNALVRHYKNAQYNIVGCAYTTVDLHKFAQSKSIEAEKFLVININSLDAFFNEVGKYEKWSPAGMLAALIGLSKTLGKNAVVEKLNQINRNDYSNYLEALFPQT